MLYSAETHTLTETVAPGLIRSDGSTLTEAGVEELAKMQGRAIEAGPVDRVEAVFMVKEDAEALLPAFKRFGVECRAIVEGRMEVLHPGTRVKRVSDAEVDGGPLVPILREASWPHLGTAVHRRLLAGPVDQGPWVTFGWDAPDTVTRMMPKHLKGRTVEEVEAEAVASLATRGFEPRRLSPGALGLPGEYASEAILIPEVMENCARILGAKLMVVAIPKEARLVAVNAEDLDQVRTVIATTREMFDSADGRRISPIPFLVSEGRVVGFASEKEGRDTPAEKPWYKFW